MRAEEAGAGPAAVASGAVSCVLTPEMTEGTYYLPDEAVRHDITEGRLGTPLALHLSVVNVSSCKPIAAAKVDVWHADAGGVYSGVQGNTGTFMRGIQRTNAKGSRPSTRSTPAGTWDPRRQRREHRPALFP
jgi:protocatechuate 3,4-dioxygenase beta subunit